MVPLAGLERDRGLGHPAVSARTLAWTTRGYIAAVCVLAALYYTAPGRAYTWALLGLFGVAGMVGGMLVHRPAHRTPWILLAAALATFVVADLIDNLRPVTEFSGAPFPSVPDETELVAYPLAAVGLWLFIRHQRSGRGAAALVDAGIVTTALALLAWTFLIWPIVDETGRTVLSREVSVSYPLGDVLLLVVLAGLVAGSSPPRPPAIWLISLGTLGLLGSDLAFQLDVLHSSWSLGTSSDLGWIFFFGSWGLAGLHPSMTEVGRESDSYRSTEISRVGFVLLTVACFVTPAVLLAAALRNGVREAGVLAGFAAVSVALVLTRLALVLRSYRRATGRAGVVRAAGASLVAAVGVDEVASALAQAGRSLLGTHGGRIVLLTDLDEPAAPARVRPVPATRALAADAGVGIGAVAIAGAVADVADAVDPADGSASHAAPSKPTAVDGTGPDADRGYALVFPLTVKRAERPAAVLATGSRDQLTELCDTVETLAGQAALALDRVQLGTEIRRLDNEAYFRTLIHNATDVFMIIGERRRVRYASPSAYKLFGSGSIIAGHDLIGADLTDLVGPENAVSALDVLAGTAPRPEEWVIEHDLGERVWVEVRSDDLRADPTVGGVVLTLRDITERRRLEGELRHHAYHDPLTGLANRLSLQDRLGEAFDRAGRTGRTASLLLIDLDDFKDVNDTKGHGVGDELLAAVADRLRFGLRPQDLAARIGGDEFAVLLPDVSGPADADALARRLTRTFNRPFELEGTPVNTGASIGVASTDGCGSAEDLLRNADLALYAAKGDGKRSWRHYDPALHDQALERAALREHLTRAIADGTVLLHYQPVVEIGDGRVAGFEALARWPHPMRGMVGPDVFIPLAEETGQILPLGRLLMRQAVADAAAWNRRREQAQAEGGGLYVPPLTVAVNVSLRQFRDNRFAAETTALLEAAGLPPHLLVLELTESDLMRNHDPQARRTLAVLKDRGVRIAIDDFGTGYSSLSYLRDLPIDIVKIDKSFIADIPTSAEQAALVEGIIRIADGLGLSVVAEGVETQQQWNLLGGSDCDYGQGYLFAPPMSRDSVDDLLGASRDPRLPRSAEVV
jgi:diguanylate cyclase (GGDEF)-like protein/PAS domain S-box-containing protein